MKPIPSKPRCATLWFRAAAVSTVTVPDRCCHRQPWPRIPSVKDDHCPLESHTLSLTALYCPVTLWRAACLCAWISATSCHPALHRAHPLFPRICSPFNAFSHDSLLLRFSAPGPLHPSSVSSAAPVFSLLPPVFPKLDIIVELSCSPTNSLDTADPRPALSFLLVRLLLLPRSRLFRVLAL